MSIKCEWVSPYDNPGIPKNSETYRITKSRGKLTLEDIQQAVIGAGLDCAVAIVLKCFADGYDGWWDTEEKKSDSVIVYVINEGSDCPVCGKLTPMLQYCPDCGRKLDTQEESQ